MSCAAGEVSAQSGRRSERSMNTEKPQWADLCAAYRIVVERREEQLAEELRLGDARQARHPAAHCPCRKVRKCDLATIPIGASRVPQLPPRPHGRGARRSPSAQPHARAAGQCVRPGPSLACDQVPSLGSWRGRLRGARRLARALVLRSAVVHEAGARPPMRCSSAAAILTTSQRRYGAAARARTDDPCRADAVHQRQARAGQSHACDGGCRIRAQRRR